MTKPIASAGIVAVCAFALAGAATGMFVYAADQMHSMQAADSTGDDENTAKHANPATVRRI